MEYGAKSFLLRGVVQHYAWGGYEFIPRLLGIDNAEGRPFAEYWMGTHPRGPAQVRIGADFHPLPDLVANAPDHWLGPEVSQRFGPNLPFLFKVLDVRKMLSIQAHPNKRQAEEGFARENEEGIPRDAFDRVFRDDNHKPELMVARSTFYLLHGFQSPRAIARTLGKYPAFAPLLAVFADRSLPDLYRHVTTLPQEAVDRLLGPLRDHLDREAAASPFPPDTPEYWARQAFADYTSPEGHFDRGVFSIFFLNLLRLEPGQAIFQAAGVPHAYLQGVNVELMASSDNVFRGGLTEKHVDPDALMRHLDFNPVQPRVLSGSAVSEHERSFPSPARDFALHELSLPAGAQATVGPYGSIQIMLVLEGVARVISEGAALSRGQAIVLKPRHRLTLRAGEDFLAYRAGVPLADG